MRRKYSKNGKCHYRNGIKDRSNQKFHRSWGLPPWGADLRFMPAWKHPTECVLCLAGWMLSLWAVRLVPRYRTFFERRDREGKVKMYFLVAVDLKLLSVFYSILWIGKPYDPNWEENFLYTLVKPWQSYSNQRPLFFYLKTKLDSLRSWVEDCKFIKFHIIVQV